MYSVIGITINLLTSDEKRVGFYAKLEKGKPPEKAGRKVTGLSLYGIRRQDCRVV